MSNNLVNYSYILSINEAFTNYFLWLELRLFEAVWFYDDTFFTWAMDETI